MPHAFSLPRISTNVRFAASHLLFPELAGAWAERMFLTPPRGRDAAASALDLIDARRSFLEHKGRHIAMFTWGARSKDAPAVLLAHGWGGHAAQMRAFAFPLLQAMLPKVALLRQEQQAVVQEIAVAELTRQKERLAVYATQARFAVAQLYDRANIKKEADHAAAPR